MYRIGNVEITCYQCVACHRDAAFIPLYRLGASWYCYIDLQTVKGVTR